MKPEDHLALLKDGSKSVIERIKSALQLKEVDYWSDPNKSPPNLARDEFEKLVVYIPLNVHVKWTDRTSDAGPHGKTGEDKVFNLEFEITRGRFRYIYYLKGYFYDQTDLKGVCIQSFRLEKKIPRSVLRAVK